MKTALFAAAALFAGLPAATALAQPYDPAPGSTVQEQLHHARDKAAHDETHRQIEDAHDSAHAGGFSSEQEHQAYHQNLGQVHGDVHDEHAEHHDAHEQIQNAHDQAHANGFRSDQEHQAYHQDLNQVHDQVHGSGNAPGYAQQYGRTTSSQSVQRYSSTRVYPRRLRHRHTHHVHQH